MSGIFNIGTLPTSRQRDGDSCSLFAMNALESLVFGHAAVPILGSDCDTVELERLRRLIEVLEIHIEEVSIF